MGWNIDRKLESHEIIEYDDIHILIRNYTYDAASTVQPVIATLGTIYKHLLAGEVYEYRDKDGTKKVLTFNGFKDFVSEYFDGNMYDRAISYYHEHQNDKKEAPDENTSAADNFIYNLDNHRAIRENELASLLYLCVSDDVKVKSNATRVLYRLYCRLRKGRAYEYCDKDGNIKPLDINNFREFMLVYFDESIYCNAVLFEFISCIHDHRPIFYEDLESAVGLCKSDRAFVIDALCFLMRKTYGNEQCSYYDKNGKHCSLTKYNFKIFITDYFGEEIYLEMCNLFNIKN